MSKNSDRAVEVASAAKHRIDATLGHIWWAILLRGLLAIVLAICAFLWPQQTLGLLVKLLGGYFLIDGLIGAVGVYSGGEKVSTMMQAIVSLAIGLVLLLWTGISAKLFLILVGVWLLLQGVGLFLAALKMDAQDGARGLTMGIGGAMAIIGLVFVFWPNTGIVAISWLIGIGALLIGCLLVFLATRVERLQVKVSAIGEHS